MKDDKYEYVIHAIKHHRIGCANDAGHAFKIAKNEFDKLKMEDPSIDMGIVYQTKTEGKTGRQTNDILGILPEDKFK